MTHFFMRSFFLLSLAVLTLCSCTKTDSPDPGDDIVTPGDPVVGNNIVTGKVVDLNGNPLAGVRLRAENPTGNNIHLNAISAADGTYKIQLTSIGGWTVYAWKETEFNGSLYVMRLANQKEEEYQPFSPGTKPVIRNFVWQLSGRIPDRSISKENGTGHFGGTIRFTNMKSDFTEIDPGTLISITFTPVDGAKFVDGSSAAGKVITKTFTIVAGVGQAYYINDLPLTTYQITAKAGNKVVVLGDNNPDVFKTSQRYTMPAAPGTGGSYESGIGSPNEHSFFISLQK